MSKPRKDDAPDDESLPYLQGTSHGNYTFTELTKQTKKPSPRIVGFVRPKVKKRKRKCK